MIILLTIFLFFRISNYSKMNQQNRKCQHLEHQHEENGNELGEPVLKMANYRRLRVPLPLELNCQIFACLKFESQRKFIGGLGRGIYGMFRHKVLTKSKRLCNPEQNGWEDSNTGAIISSNGLLASDNTAWVNVYSKKGFPISSELSRTDNFPGTILYYFEVTIMVSPSYRRILIGLSNRNIPNGSFVGLEPNSYAIQDCSYYCWLFVNDHPFEWPDGAIKPEWKWDGNVYGCGLLLNPENKLSIFFTGNGLLMGKQIPIHPTVDILYSTVSMAGNALVDANFGDDSAKPFSYDIKKCPGMVFE